MSTNRIVIARYGENLDWVAGIPAGFEVHIVNKGASLAAAPVLERADSIVERPNAGREGETFLTYLIDGQHVDGVTVFLQGDPFEHSPDIIGLLRHWRDWGDVQPLSWRWRAGRNIPPASILAREQADFVAGQRVRAERFALGTWGPPGFRDPGTEWLADTYGELHGLEPGVNIAGHFLRSCGLHDLAERADSHAMGRFAYGAAFAVRNVRAHAPARESLLLMRQACVGHEVYGYVIERLWLHLFGEPFLVPVGAAPRDCPSAPGLPTEPGRFQPADTTSRPARVLRRVTRRVRRMVSG